jgi:hypothetical protein
MRTNDPQQQLLEPARIDMTNKINSKRLQDLPATTQCSLATLSHKT